MIDGGKGKVFDIPCKFCGAQPGNRCVSLFGRRRLDVPHVDRTRDFLKKKKEFMADTQRFNLKDAIASDDVVRQMRVILSGLPIAVAVSAADIVKDDVHRQLQFGHSQFAGE